MDGFSSGFPLVSQEQRARATLGIAGARGAQRGELHAQQRAAVFRGFTVTAFGVAAGLDVAIAAQGFVVGLVLRVRSRAQHAQVGAPEWRASASSVARSGADHSTINGAS